MVSSFSRLIISIKQYMCPGSRSGIIQRLAKIFMGHYLDKKRGRSKYCCRGGEHAFDYRSLFMINRVPDCH